MPNIKVGSVLNGSPIFPVKKTSESTLVDYILSLDPIMLGFGMYAVAIAVALLR